MAKSKIIKPLDNIAVSDATKVKPSLQEIDYLYNSKVPFGTSNPYVPKYYKKQADAQFEKQKESSVIKKTDTSKKQFAQKTLNKIKLGNNDLANEILDFVKAPIQSTINLTDAEKINSDEDVLNRGSDILNILPIVGAGTKVGIKAARFGQDVYDYGKTAYKEAKVISDAEKLNTRLMGNSSYKQIKEVPEKIRRIGNIWEKPTFTNAEELDKLNRLKKLNVHEEHLKGITGLDKKGIDDRIEQLSKTNSSSLHMPENPTLDDLTNLITHQNRNGFDQNLQNYIDTHLTNFENRASSIRPQRRAALDAESRAAINGRGDDLDIDITNQDPLDLIDLGSDIYEPTQFNQLRNLNLNFLSKNRLTNPVPKWLKNTIDKRFNKGLISKIEDSNSVVSTNPALFRSSGNVEEALKETQKMIDFYPSGTKIRGASSLSDSSFPLVIANMKKNILNNNLKNVEFGGYNNLNYSGYLNKAQIHPDVVVPYLNSHIDELSKTLGKKIPKAYYNEDGIKYPDLIGVKMRKGGRIQPPPKANNVITRSNYPSEVITFNKKVEDLPKQVVKPKPKKVEPIYVDDPNDPRLKAYQDSNTIYNFFKDDVKMLQTVKNFNEWEKYTSKANANEKTLNAYTRLRKLNNESPVYKFNTHRKFSDLQEGEAGSFTKPVQPVILKSRPEPIKQMPTRGFTSTQFTSEPIKAAVQPIGKPQGYLDMRGQIEEKLPTSYQGYSEKQIEQMGYRKPNITTYKKGGSVFKDIGAGLYGAGEGLLDTFSFGATDSFTDMGYKSLQKLGNSTEEEIRQQDSIHGYSQTAGAVTSAIINPATLNTAISEGSQGLGQGISKGSPDSKTAQAIGTYLPMAGKIPSMSDPMQMSNTFGNMDNIQIAKNGGMIFKNNMAKDKTLINVEKGELEVNPNDLKIVKEFRNKPKHPSIGIDADGNTMATVDNIIIPRKMNELYKKGSILQKKAMINNLQFDQAKRDGTKYRFGGVIKKYDGSNGSVVTPGPRVDGGYYNFGSSFTPSNPVMTNSNSNSFSNLITPTSFKNSATKPNINTAAKPSINFTPSNDISSSAGTNMYSTRPSSFDWNNTASNIGGKALEYSPAIYNLGRGLFDKALQLNEKDYLVNDQLNPPVLTGEAGRRDMLKAYNLAKYNNRQMNGNQAGMNNLFGKYSDSLASFNENLENKNKVAKFEADKYGIENKFRNASTRLNLKQFNEQNKAAKRDFTSKGLTQASDIYQNERNNEIMSKNLPNFLKYYDYDAKGNLILKSNKSTK